MALTVCADLSAASWLTSSDLAELDWWRLVTVGPDGFERQARLRFIPDPEWEGQSENDVLVEEDLPAEHEVMAVAAAVLTRHTGTPDDCYFGWWDGWPTDLPGPKFELPHRAYHLLRGAVSDLSGWGGAAIWAAPHRAYPPAFVWPADRSWCIARDVDPHFAGISGGAAAIAELVGAPALDVVPLPPGVDPPYYR